MANDNDFSFDVVNLPQAAPKKSAEYLAAYKGWAYSATSLISIKASTIPINLFKIKNRGTDNEEIEQVTDHPSLDVLQFVNDESTWQQLRDETTIYKLLMGESAWYIVRDGGGDIVGILFLRPDWIDVVPNGRGGIKSYIYHPGGHSSGQVELSSEDVLFYKDFDPLEMYRGYGKIRPSAISIDQDDFGDEWNRNIFFNSGMASFIMSTERTLTKEQKRRFMNNWQQQFGGKRNAHKVAFIDGGKINVEKISADPQELDFNDSKDRIMDKILSSFHVSKSNLGITTDVNRSNSEAQERQLLTNAVVPELVTFVGFLNEFYLTLWDDTDDMFYNFENPVKEDREALVKEVSAGLNPSTSYMSLNEARQKLDMDVVDGGDYIYKQIATQIVASTGDDEVPEDQGQEGDGDDNEQDQEDENQDQEQEERGLFQRIADMTNMTKKIKVEGVKPDVKHVMIKVKRPESKLDLVAPIPPRRMQKKKIERIYKKLETPLKKMIVQAVKKSLENRSTVVKNGDTISRYTKEDKDEQWKDFEETTEPQTRKIEKIVLELASEQKDLVIKTIKGAPGFRTPSRVSWNKTKENKRWTRKLRPVIAETVNLAGDATLEELAGMVISKQFVDFDMSDERVQLYLRSMGLTWINDINETTLERIAKTLAEGIANGETEEQLIERVLAVYEQFKDYRAETIGDTQGHQGANTGIDVAYDQSGVVAGKEWLSARDASVRDAHLVADGQQVKLNDRFDVGGDKLLYPQDSAGSPGNVVNCRCTTVPLLKEDFKAIKDCKVKDKQEFVNDIVKVVAKKQLKSTLFDAIDELENEKKELGGENERLELVGEQVKRELVSTLEKEVDKAGEAIGERKTEDVAIAKHEVNELKEQKTVIDDLTDKKVEEIESIDKKLYEKEANHKKKMENREATIKEKELDSKAVINREKDRVAAEIKAKKRSLKGVKKVVDNELDKKREEMLSDVALEKDKAEKKLSNKEETIREKELDSKARLNRETDKAKADVKAEKGKLEGAKKATEKELDKKREDVVIDAALQKESLQKELDNKKATELEKIADEVEKEKSQQLNALQRLGAKFKDRRKKVGELEEDINALEKRREYKEIEDRLAGAKKLIKTAEKRGGEIISGARKAAVEQTNKIVGGLKKLRDKIKGTLDE